MNIKKQREVEKINPKKKKGLSKKELEKVLGGWQKKLSMGDWNIAIEIVDFKRTDYKQSGDFKANLVEKTASILMTWNPFLEEAGNIEEEEKLTILHELIHIMLWDYDQATEKIILKNYKKYGVEHIKYLEKIENLVDQLTKIFEKIK